MPKTLTKPHVGQKKLQNRSKYNKYDVSGDGVVSDSELELVKGIQEMEAKEAKADAQRGMSWVALSGMVIYTGLLFSPIIPIERVNALGDLLGLYYIGQASVIGFYFGAQAYMSKK
jgi:hypothetical protein